MTSWQNWLHGTKLFRKNVAIKQSKMLAYRYPNKGIPVCFEYVLKLNAYDPSLAMKVRKVLNANKAEHHIRGGMVTKEKYLSYHGLKKN